MGETTNEEMESHILDELRFRNAMPQFFSEEERTLDAVIAYVHKERDKGRAALHKPPDAL